MITSVRKTKNVYNVSFRGEKPTNKDVYNFCKEKLSRILNDEDYKMLCYLFKKIKAKYDNKQKNIQLLKVVINYIESENLQESTEIWGS